MTLLEGAATSREFKESRASAMASPAVSVRPCSHASAKVASSTGARMMGVVASFTLAIEPNVSL